MTLNLSLDESLALYDALHEAMLMAEDKAKLYRHKHLSHADTEWQRTAMEWRGLHAKLRATIEKGETA